MLYLPVCFAQSLATYKKSLINFHGMVITNNLPGNAIKHLKMFNFLS